MYVCCTCRCLIHKVQDESLDFGFGYIQVFLGASKDICYQSIAFVLNKYYLVELKHFVSLQLLKVFKYETAQGEKEIKSK